jgi:hypothetical protein
LIITMKLQKASFALMLTTATLFVGAAAQLPELPINSEDFDEPDWEAILLIAFPTWAIDGPCGSLASLGGEVDVEAPTKLAGGGKWNPCYYTKRFAGLDPVHGGYPTPIDTRYPYEFAAPFFAQPGDGSTHHCPIDSPLDTPIGACPKVNNPCPNGEKDCVVIGEYGIGHIPPFVPLAAIKNEYLDEEGRGDICSTWFDYDLNRCDIKKDVLDELVYKYFGNGTQIKFQPPILIDDAPSNTYYRLEFGGESPACAEGNCRGPHYCSTDVADAGVIWGDFCPYVHTGENSGLYRHPHLALSALQQMIANACMPDLCGTEWDAGASAYPPAANVSTSITWCEMDNNEDAMAQPAVPYVWPIVSKEGGLPGPDRYDSFKPAEGLYVNELVLLSSGTTSSASDTPDDADEVSGTTSSASASFFETAISTAASAVVVMAII